MLEYSGAWCALRWLGTVRRTLVDINLLRSVLLYVTVPSRDVQSFRHTRETDNGAKRQAMQIPSTHDLQIGAYFDRL